jgi:hypothetical protein
VRNALARARRAHDELMQLLQRPANGQDDTPLPATAHAPMHAVTVHQWQGFRIDDRFHAGT